MKKFGKKDLAALVLVVAYLLSGCKASSKTPDKGETKRSNDVAYEEIVSSLMEKYKESSFIKDYGLYSDIYPVLYVGDTGSLNDDGVLTNSFSNFTGGGMSIELYYLYLMEMYENQAYQKDENGNLIFDWSAVNGKFVKFDTTVFSHQNDETGKNFRFEDKKDGNLVFARDIRDNGKEVFNKITLQRDLSEDVHVTINATHHQDNYFGEWDDDAILRGRYEADLMIDYCGEIYSFKYQSIRIGEQSDRYVILPEGMVVDQNDVNVYFDLIGLICNDSNYRYGVNLKAIEYFERLLQKKKCLAIYYQGSAANPYYEYVTELIDNGQYVFAQSIMEDPFIHWISKNITLGLD